LFFAIMSAGLAIAVIMLAVSLSNVNDVSSDSTTLRAATNPATTMQPVTTAKQQPQQPQEPWEKEYRLPLDTVPVHYDINLHPDLETGQFSGRVDLRLTTTESRKFFLVHIKFLEITSTVVTVGHSYNGEAVKLLESFEYLPNEFWVVPLAKKVDPGNYTLSLDFKGSLTKDIVGFYKSVYYNSDTNVSRAIATSKFEPTYARRAFPCFDEPSFKSTFTVSLVRPMTDGYSAYSNMPEESRKDNYPSEGLATVTFEKSVPMVTYLACFIVCDFQIREGKTARGIPFRVLSRSNQINSTEYPLQIGIAITDYYEKYFGIDYVLPKQDLVAIPDFVSGAMEHWGLVTFRETALLYNPKESSTGNQKRVATVVAHELAHQWFGNLMTIKWWDDLWLNEGFASYIEYKGVNACEPEWDIETQILSDDVQSVFKLDSKLSSHPIVQTVNHPDEITEIFDSISYSKGASVLRMLEHFMDPLNFQKGIQNFLKKYKFANAATPDLWNELQEITPHLNISRIMNTWTRQMGYPVLSYTLSGDNLTITQSRFLDDPKNQNNLKDTPSPYGYKWDVPIFYVTDKASEIQSTWLKMEQDSVTVKLPSDFTWVKLNAGQNGFYRVNYSADHWKALGTALLENNTVLTAADRWGVVDDVFSLAAAGTLSYSTALDTVKYIKKDRHPVPWVSALDKLASISSLLYSTNLYPGFRKFIISLVNEPFEELGWEDAGSHLNKSLRVNIVQLGCMSGSDPCLNGAASMFLDWVNNSKPISPNFRSLVYRYGMSQKGDATSWNTMWERYITQTDPQESVKLQYGLAFPKDPWIIQQYLEYAKNENYVRSQDYFSVLQYISLNPVGLPIVWDFVRTEWQYLVDRFTVNNRYLGRMVNYVTSQFTTNLRLEEMKAFFAQNPEAGAGARAREQALETVQNNISWLATNKETIETWLKNNGYMS